MGKHTLIAVGNTVVCLVDDDGVKIIAVKTRKALFAHQRLHGADDDAVPAPETAFLRLLRRAEQAGRRADFVGGLLQKLAPVGEYQNPLPETHAVLCNFCKHNGLAAAGRQHEQRAVCAAVPLVRHGLPGLLLVRSEFHIRSPPAYTSAQVPPQSRRFPAPESARPR